MALELARQIPVGRPHAAQELDAVGGHTQAHLGDQPDQRQHHQQGGDAAGDTPPAHESRESLGPIAGGHLGTDGRTLDHSAQLLLEGRQIEFDAWIQGDIDQPGQRQIHLGFEIAHPGLDQGCHLRDGDRHRRGHAGRLAQDVHCLRDLLFANAGIVERWQGDRDHLDAHAVATQPLIGDRGEGESDNGEIEQSPDGPGQKAAGGALAQGQVDARQLHD